MSESTEAFSVSVSASPIPVGVLDLQEANTVTTTPPPPHPVLTSAHLTSLLEIQILALQILYPQAGREHHSHNTLDLAF